MTRDLGDVMWSAVGERTSSLDDVDLDANDLTRLRSRVRRGRTVRHVREAAVAIPVVAAVAAAGWFGVDRMTATPPADESPEPVQPTPSPEATDGPDGPDDAVLGELVEEPGLPTYHELSDAVLDEVGPGWLVTSYRPTRTVEMLDDFGYETLVTALFLVAPDGTHFLVERFDPDANVYPVAWTAGDTAVDVIVDAVTAGYAEQRTGQDLMPATYDLRTGTFTEREGEAVWPPDSVPREPLSPSGRGVRVEYGDTFHLSSLDGTTAQLSYGVEGKVCSPVGWLREESFLALCVDEAMLTDGRFGNGATERDYRPVVVQVDLAGARAAGVTVLRELAADDPLPGTGQGVHVQDGVVAFPSVDGGLGCWTGADLWADGGFRTLQRPTGEENHFLVTAADGVVYVEASPGCAGDAQPPSLTAHDLAAGTSTLLARGAADWRPGEPGWVTQGFVAWTVAR